jgi:hypothetical protein
MDGMHSNAASRTIALGDRGIDVLRRTWESAHFAAQWQRENMGRAPVRGTALVTAKTGIACQSRCTPSYQPAQLVFSCGPVHAQQVCDWSIDCIHTSNVGDERGDIADRIQDLRDGTD